MAAYAGFMTHVTCRLTAKNRDQLQNTTLGNRVWATFFGLSKQLAKINNSSFNTTHSAQNLGFIFDEHLTFFWPDCIRLHILLLPYSLASLYLSIPQYQNSFHHRHFRCSLQAWLLQLSLSQPAQLSHHPAPTDPELSCTSCCQSSQIQSHHSHPSVSAVVKDNWAHN